MHAGTARLDFDLADIAKLVHGTTVATTTIIERKGARTALLTTAGFRDVLEDLQKAPGIATRARRSCTIGGGWSRLDADFPKVSEVTSLPVSELLGVVIADHRPARAWAIVAATNASFAFL
jgi:hypothetical protein